MLEDALEQVVHFQNGASEFPAAVVGGMAMYSKHVQSIVSPIDNAPYSQLCFAESDHVTEAVSMAYESFLLWRKVPAPKRGELVRVIGNIARAQKSQLAALITLEAGKTWQESLGEVQELIDVCDFAVGLSRQLYGLTIASERPDHRMMEQWHPLGVVGVISAFNFPMAVWAWNAALALVCGNALVWKPSEKTPLCAFACHQLVQQALEQLGWEADFPSLSSVVNGDRDIGKALASNKRVALVSATGSVPMGRAVAKTVAERLGRCLLELGGNNGLIVSRYANQELALKAAVFSAIGTSGQRCTSLRRLFIHEAIYDVFLKRMISAYETIRIGDPSDQASLLGPLISEHAYNDFLAAIKSAQDQGAKLLYGGARVTDGVPDGFYVTPAIVAASHDMNIIQQETFAPLLYVFKYRDLEEVIQWHNSVPQGLSSAIFTDNLQEAELFVSAQGSDCGIANINIGTSGAEIGGAFGGEKDTGGGRESGSDAWKNYMRRATNTINYGTDIPLAQGIKFNL
ncbi:MAG: aldehyde dehydrogenase family protein [Pseudomonadales bacterium]|nr:aldehyde dehydrogenase family protein [Pseudomonadales bacterium]